MLNFKVEGLPMPVDDKDAANKVYVDTLTEDRRKKLEINNPFNFDNGVYGAKNKINMKGNKIEGVGFPDLPEDVATVAYVDEVNPWERKNGGFVAKEHIYLGRKKLGGLKDPTAEREAATKGYVDKEMEKIKEELKQNNNIPDVKNLVRISKNVFIIQATAKAPFYQDETPFFFVNPGYSVDINDLSDVEKRRHAFYFFPFKGRITGYFMEILDYGWPLEFYIDIYDKPKITEHDEERFVNKPPQVGIDRITYKKLNSFFFNDHTDPTDGHKFFKVIYSVERLNLMCVKREIRKPIEFNPCQSLVVRVNKTGGNLQPTFCTLSLFLEIDDNDLINTNLENVLINKNWDMKNNKILNIADPEDLTDAVNRKYVDEEIRKIEENLQNIQPVAPGVDPAELDKIKTDLEKNQAFNTRNQKTFNARGNINMKQKTIRNIPEPVEITDAVPLGYVNELKEFFEDRIKEVEDKAKEAKDAADRAARAQPGGGAGNGNGADFGDMKGKKLLNVGDPENSGDGVNKKYVDQKTPFNKSNGYYSTTHGINMDFKKITNLGEPTADGDGVNKKYVDDLNFFEREGEYIKSKQTILMDGKTIEQLGKPNFLTDATNKEYVDEKFKNIPFTKVNGHFIASSNLDMGVKKITNLALPSDKQDATNKDYVDEEIKKLVEEDRKRKTETDRIRVLVNEKDEEIKKLEKNDKKIKNEMNKLSTFINEQTEENSEEIEKLKIEEEEKREKLKQDLTNEYNDKILQTFVAEKQNDILMNGFRVTNLGEPIEEQDAVNKKYADNLAFSKERILRFLGTSLILIRGEAKGPIIGMEEVKNSNSRIITNLGRLALDKDNKIIKPTIVYFSKYESATVDSEVILNGVLTEVQTEISPNYLIPFKGSIFNITFTVTSLEKRKRREPVELVLRLTSGKNFDGTHASDVLNLSTGVFEASNTKEYKFGRNFVVGGWNAKQYRICYNLPKDEVIKFDECTSIYLYFSHSMKDLDSIFITLGAQIYNPNFNEDYFPNGFTV